MKTKRTLPPACKREWQDNDGPGYMVTPWGAVYSCRNTNGTPTAEWRLIKPALNSTGTVIYDRSIKGKRHTRIVGRAVLEIFGGKPPSRNYWCVHLDGNPANNHLNNLAWLTPAEAGELRAISNRASHGHQHHRAIANGWMLTARGNKRKPAQHRDAALNRKRRYRAQLEHQYQAHRRNDAQQ